VRTGVGVRRAGTAFAAVAVLCGGLLASSAFPATSRAAGGARPDAWVKLCGGRNTCSTQPWHPWVGNDVYNTTGAGQQITAGVEEGNTIRFWLLLENDGAAPDTLTVKGCPGTTTFPILGVNVGAYRFHTRQQDVTSRFRAGTLSFPFPAASVGKTVILTITFQANTHTRGVRYTCPVTVLSTNAPAVKDHVAATAVTI